MYERMLDKTQKPSFEEMASYCGSMGELFQELNGYLQDQFQATYEIRFPCGNQYGWGMGYKYKSKHICDIFAEKEAFTLMIRLSNKQIEAVYETLSPEAQSVCDHKYPCGEGGWLHFRVTSNEKMLDAKQLLSAKMDKISRK